MALAWSRGADPYALYNGLDESLRPLAHRHPCPSCWAVRRSVEPCSVCGLRGYVEIPLDEPGEPLLPPYPKRYRNFLYGLAMALEERDTQKARAGGIR